MAYVKAQPFLPQFEDVNGNPLESGTVEFYVWNTSTPTPYYTDDNGTSGGTSLTLNNLGYPPDDIFFDDSVVYKLITKDSAGSVIDTLGPFYPPYSRADASVVEHVASMSALKSRGAGRYDGEQIYLQGRASRGDNGGGEVHWDGSDLSTEVAADEVTVGEGDGGIYTAPSTDKTGASGAYVRTVVDVVSAPWYGDDSAAFQAAADAASRHNLELIGDGETYTASFSLDSPMSMRAKINGAITLKNPPNWHMRKIENVWLDGENSHNCIEFESEGVGRYELHNMRLSGYVRGINKAAGQIGNAIYGTTFTGGDYGYWARSSASPVMHTGAELIERAYLKNHDFAAMYIDSSVDGTGGNSIKDTVIESNPGYGIYVAEYAEAVNALLLDSVWFEGNATAGSVTIDGVAQAPVDLHLQKANNVHLTNSRIPDLRCINSQLAIDNCRGSFDYSTYDIDVDSVIIGTNLQFDGGSHPITVYSLKGQERIAGNQVGAFRSPVRVPRPDVGAGVLVRSIPFTDNDSYSLSGTTTVTTSPVDDGRMFDRCAEAVIPAGNTNQSGSIVTTADKWYVITVDVKHTSGNFDNFNIDLSFDYNFARNMTDAMVSGDWVTLAVVAKTTSSGTIRLRFINSDASSQTVRVSGLQAIEFDTQQDAVDFYNDMTFVHEGMSTYTPSNVTEDRTYDADSTSTAELADVLGTLIDDLKGRGIID